MRFLQQLQLYITRKHVFRKVFNSVVREISAMTKLKLYDAKKRQWLRKIAYINSSNLTNGTFG